MLNISDRQEKMLAFIRNFVRQNGYPPTREEIKTGLDISTKSLVNYHLKVLEDADCLRRIPNTPRGIRLTGGNGIMNMPLKKSVKNSGMTFVNLDSKDVVELTYDMAGHHSKLYALKAEGSTLIDSFVNDGDIVILQEQKSAKNGEMVAVQMPEQDRITLRRYYRENGHVRLEAANTAMKPVFMSPDRVKIQGKVVAIIRHMD